MPDTEAKTQPGAGAGAAPSASDALAVRKSAEDSKPKGEQYVVLADYIYTYSRGSLITADQLPQEPEAYIKQGSLKRATQADIKRGYAETENLPVYDSGALTSIPREALIEQAKNERLAKPLDNEVG
jgi:hypothetical protein